MSEPPRDCTPIPFDVCRRLVVEAANELLIGDRRLKGKGLSALTAADVRQLPRGGISIVMRSVDGDAVAGLRVEANALVWGEQFLKNAVTVNLIKWLTDRQPAKTRKTVRVKQGEDGRRNRRDRGR